MRSGGCVNDEKVPWHCVDIASQSRPVRLTQNNRFITIISSGRRRKANISLDLGTVSASFLSCLCEGLCWDLGRLQQHLRYLSVSKFCLSSFFLLLVADITERLAGGIPKGRKGSVAAGQPAACSLGGVVVGVGGSSSWISAAGHSTALLHLVFLQEQLIGAVNPLSPYYIHIRNACGHDKKQVRSLVGTAVGSWPESFNILPLLQVNTEI